MKNKINYVNTALQGNRMAKIVLKPLLPKLIAVGVKWFTFDSHNWIKLIKLHF
jgi:hypothetical protein